MGTVSLHAKKKKKTRKSTIKKSPCSNKELETNAEH
jgi:hypothetical protein